MEDLKRLIDAGLFLDQFREEGDWRALFMVSEILSTLVKERADLYASELGLSRNQLVTDIIKQRWLDHSH